MIIPYLVFGILVLMMIFLLFGRAQEVEIPHLLSDQEILQLAQQGKKIEAIKCYRSLHNVGLKQAKEAVEAMLKQS
ncbi:MAG: ribosomal protein L7/L12 [Woronichinia naegeliana WA131]|jgi:ribosomal protein L7/L12|uniref:Ribosomal protein L7/L12 n=1 Tax=Woronichinia naegeliana WA131 TaxID=2824559 RepID=A0A977KT35_9CYAN|nr:MAG: ribosomal protein L7/L12 [Woronichinia naegeliana WA131]